MRSHGAWRHPPPVFRQSPFRARLPKSAFYIQFPPQKYPITSVCRPATGSMSALGLVSRVLPVHTAVRNCTRDEGGPFEVGNQVLVLSHRKLLSSKAMVVNVAETPGQDSGRQG
jgi:hypothetical protein